MQSLTKSPALEAAKASFANPLANIASAREQSSDERARAAYSQRRSPRDGRQPGTGRPFEARGPRKLLATSHSGELLADDILP
eukprot:CAMPEP_0115143342 /NCGR_PEP_ID=MMETSP0227-20121206/60714_1 /TAXON_ID=89957 /ORGANISM="Polarella glacialis, Strain CCMP 1383" /LENGTH=82 /DNA_ID=CAMNT_0002552153 /DNA_START=536 /DNA_END=785 /DNA_ORIENTATION=-